MEHATYNDEQHGPVQKILVLDDEHEIGYLVAAAARSMQIDCITTTTPADFLNHLSAEITVIVLDLMMPQMDGVEMLRLLSKGGCEASIILASGVGRRVMETTEDLAKRLQLHVVGHLQKPFRILELKSLITKANRLQRNAFPKGLPGKKKFGAQQLREAIDNDEFIVHYQPQIDLSSRSVAGVEALVRWQHPTEGLISPDDFITLMEAEGLLTDLGWLVARRALSEWHLLAHCRGGFPQLSLNISVSSLQDLAFPEAFLKLIHDAGVSPDRVVLEITEGGLLQKLSTTLDVLVRLRMKGVQLSIDDFGTGYSMMFQLRNIPATEIKVDKSFVQNLFESEANRVMVEKTIEIGHDLGMKVVAEGIETEEQLEFLSSRHCDIGQGYYFSRPLPPMELARWIADFEQVTNGSHP